MSKRPLVCYTTLPLHLGRVGRAQLLPALFSTVCIPESVATELDMGRLMRPDILDPRDLSGMILISVPERDVEALPLNRLGPGERAAIAYVRSHPDFWAGLDDRQARELAEDLGLDVVGTIGGAAAGQEGRLDSGRPTTAGRLARRGLPSGRGPLS